MNPITNIKNRQRDRENEVLQGLSEKASYHYDFKHSAYIYAGQLSFKLTEGDLLAIFSEYGEIVDVNLVRCADAIVTSASALH
jgi:RNA-binding motif protein, X-linked 2